MALMQEGKDRNLPLEAHSVPYACQCVVAVCRAEVLVTLEGSVIPSTYLLCLLCLYTTLRFRIRI